MERPIGGCRCDATNETIQAVGQSSAAENVLGKGTGYFAGGDRPNYLVRCFDASLPPSVLDMRILPKAVNTTLYVSFFVRDRTATPDRACDASALFDGPAKRWTTTERKEENCQKH